MISSRFAKQNGNSVQTPTSSNLDASLSPQSQLRQHGVYIGSPQPSQQQQQPVEMRGMGRSHQQQQRMYEQQQQQQRGQFPPQQQQQQQLQQQQQVTGTPQMQYKYSNLPLPPSTTYQPIMETPSSTWKHYNGEGAIPKNQGGDNVPNQGTSYQAVNTANEAGLKNYNQDCIAYNPAEPRYNQSRPPLSYQQQYRGSQRNTRPAPANSGGTSGGYQTSHGQNDYHAQQNTQYSQGSVIVHASQDGHPHHSVEDGKATSSSSKPLDIHREGPQGAAALAGPSLKDDDDEGIEAVGRQAETWSPALRGFRSSDQQTTYVRLGFVDPEFSEQSAYPRHRQARQSWESARCPGNGNDARRIGSAPSPIEPATATNGFAPDLDRSAKRFLQRGLRPRRRRPQHVQAGELHARQSQTADQVLRRRAAAAEIIPTKVRIRGMISREHKYALQPHVYE
ncbi:unnamed protein product [Nesidiocoris tenuis]|uniref:Uncharacterized protein n=1 Tax=Nesidiocoris tenuis TaxID=355587 RepID=A0A6H5G6S3_9HEMI|nr:unnamed protein product [Nesidiocoris tenuis]CAA9998451.1 unnamed protein product [Nesidiocoris tenuis]